MLRWIDPNSSAIKFFFVFDVVAVAQLYFRPRSEKNFLLKCFCTLFPKILLLHIVVVPDV